MISSGITLIRDGKEPAPNALNRYKRCNFEICCFLWRLEGSEGQSNLLGEKVIIAFYLSTQKKTQTNPNCNAPHKEFPLISRHPTHLKKKNPFFDG